MRVGIGYDVHRFEKNRKLILGGIDVPHSFGLNGHSDGDVLTHAIMDSIIGALGKGDIGRHFPDNDDNYKGVYSIELLRKVMEYVIAEKYNIVNVDCIVVAQKPKLSGYILKMEGLLGKELGTKNINIKATTTERLGFEGREEGISSQVVVLLKRLT